MCDPDNVNELQVSGKISNSLRDDLQECVIVSQLYCVHIRYVVFDVVVLDRAVAKLVSLFTIMFSLSLRLFLQHLQLSPSSFLGNRITIDGEAFPNRPN